MKGRTAAYAAALELYLDGRFDEASAAFRRVEGVPAAEVLAKRCHKLVAGPPPSAWDGVYRPKQK